MHDIQQQLLDLSKRENLAALSLREIAARVGRSSESPQKIKHHLLQLQKKGFLTLDRARGTMSRTPTQPGWATGLLTSSASLFSIPVLGTANCGPASFFAEQNIQGFLRVSSTLIGRTNPKGLYAIRASGISMDKAEVRGRRIEDGDHVIVDSAAVNPRHNDIVVVVIDNCATIKTFELDSRNQQIVLRAKSSREYAPIYLHEDDDFAISGTVVGVVKHPSN